MDKVTSEAVFVITIGVISSPKTKFSWVALVTSMVTNGFTVMVNVVACVATHEVPPLV